MPRCLGCLTCAEALHPPPFSESASVVMCRIGRPRTATRVAVLAPSVAVTEVVVEVAVAVTVLQSRR